MTLKQFIETALKDFSDKKGVIDFDVAVFPMNDKIEVSQGSLHSDELSHIKFSVKLEEE